MKIIGLTGGIGSGKSTVASFFIAQGVPVYFADEAGRKILDEPAVTSQIASIFGDKILTGGKVDRARLAQIVFRDKDALDGLNAIVHPAVKKDFEDWKLQQSGYDFVIREAAIMFESGSHHDCDKIILVTAPADVRIDRVMARDGVSREQVLARMANQWSDEKKSELSDFIIVNTDLAQTELQCAKILKKLKNL